MSTEDTGRPSKWSFRELREHFERHGLDYDGLFLRIEDLIIKTLIAAEAGVSRACQGHAGHCFEIYGFDVLIDDTLKPWLLEVNIYPSLRTDSPLDKRIKTQLVADTLTLVGLQRVQAGGSAQAIPPKTPRRQPSAVSNAGHRGDSDADMLADLAARLVGMDPGAAVAAFNEEAWEVVLDAHDEESRSGGLRRIFPSSVAGRYASFFKKESFGNVVLRKWHEAGGGSELVQPRPVPEHSCEHDGHLRKHACSAQRLPPPPQWSCT